jgi:LPS-assembly protein
MRRRVIIWSLATLVCGPPAWPQGLQPFATMAGPADAPVEIEADQMTYGYDAKILHLEGHVVARRSGGIVRAQSGVFDREHGKLSLSGGVIGVQGRQVFLADEAFVDLNAKTAEFHGGKQETTTTQTAAGGKTVTATSATDGMAVLYLKEKPANPDAPKAGKNSLILHGSTVQQKEKGQYVAQNVVITPCDCVGEPDYELLADEAVLDGDRAHLSGAHLHFPHVTLPLFPLSLPLTSRQWGLLAPQFGFSGVAGFGFALPVFVPLGESYDLTLAPGYFTGGAHSSNTPNLGARTIRGPRLGLDWRYAPVQGTSGSISFDLFYDMNQHDSLGETGPPVPGEPTTSGGRGFGGIRGVAHLLHRTEGEQGVFAVQGTVATDVLVVSDAEPASLDRLVDYLRTDVGAWRARGATTLGIDATVLQDVRIADAPPDRRLFGAERRATFQRLPAVFAQVAPNPVGPLTFGLEASAVQFVSFAKTDAGERSTGFGPTDQGISGSLPPLGPGNAARAPSLRGDFAPRLAWSGPQSLPVDLRLDLGGRADGYVEFGYPNRDLTRAYLDAGASIGFPLERRFGTSLHRIEPQIEVRGITPSLHSGGPPIGDPADGGGAQYVVAIAHAQQNLGPAPGLIFGVPSARRSFDEIDGAAPSTGAVEAVASLDQALWSKSGKTAVRWLRLNLQQDMLLGSGGGGRRLGEGSAIASVQGAFASATATVRYDWALRAISTISASGTIHDSRTDELHASTLLLRGASSERLRAGIDELFSAARLDAPPGSAEATAMLTGSLGVGGSAPLFWNFRLAYDLSRFLSPDGGLPPGFADYTHAASLAYETPCHCAALSLGVALPFRNGALLSGPVIHFVLDLKSLGSFATF